MQDPNSNNQQDSSSVQANNGNGSDQDIEDNSG